LNQCRLKEGNKSGTRFWRAMYDISKKKSPN
jgi:hypothetical protein